MTSERNNVDDDQLAHRFEAERPHLRDVAYRLLGSTGEADDAVQEAWLRLSRSDAHGIENLGGWLTTVTARLCLDVLRSRRSRSEVPLSPGDDQVRDSADPEGEALLSESVGLAMMTVLERLDPAERVAFVLHDVFSVPFDDIAPIVDRSSAATRKLASRARARVRDSSADVNVEADRRSGELAAHRNVVEAFFRASRNGDFRALLAVLDPNVTLTPDATALAMGQRNGWITGQLKGAEAVARQFDGAAEAARLALIDGAPGAVWIGGGRPVVAFVFTIEGDTVAAIELVADAERLGQVTIEVL